MKLLMLVGLLFLIGCGDNSFIDLHLEVLQSKKEICYTITSSKPKELQGKSFCLRSYNKWKEQLYMQENIEKQKRDFYYRRNCS